MLLLCVPAVAQVYRIETISQRGGSVIRGTGTAVCIGQRSTTGLFLTARHNFRGVDSFAVIGDNGPSVGYRVSLHPDDDVAAFCARGVFRAMPMSADEIPDGAPVQVCGYGPATHGSPEQFCFAASISQDIVIGSSHAIPGDSGGAAYVGLGGENVLVGIVSAYGSNQPSTDRNDGVTRKTRIVPISAVSEWLPTQYSNCPSCIPLSQPRPLQQRGIIRYRGAPPQISQPSQPPIVRESPPAVVVAPCQDDLRRLVAEYLQKNPPPAGRDGQPGADGRPGRDAEVNYEAIVEAVVSQLPPPAKGDPGPPGERGPQGERGLVGVPDDEDIRNWLIGAMADPATKQQLAVMLADLVSSDPRVDQLISRLEVVENRKHSQRVILVDGAKGDVIDDETYVEEPIVLDVRKFRGPSQ